MEIEKATAEFRCLIKLINPSNSRQYGVRLKAYAANWDPIRAQQRLRIRRLL